MPKRAALTFCSVQTGQLQHAGTTAQRNGIVQVPATEQEGAAGLYRTLQDNFTGQFFLVTQNAGWVFCELLNRLLLLPGLFTSAFLSNV